MKVSLPVIMNEPLSGLQRIADPLFTNEDIFYRAGI